MTSGAKFIIDLEDPVIDIEIVDDKSGERKLKLILVRDVVCTHGDGNIANLEYTLSA